MECYQLLLTKAYDWVNRKKLWSCLEGYGVHGCFLSFLKGLYGGSMSQVRIDGCLGEEFEVMKGLRQGVCYPRFSFPCTSTVW